MIQLPTTLEEAEALAFARHEIVKWRDMGNPWSDDCILTSKASRAFLREFLRRASLLHPINRLDIIAWARAGDPDARAALATLIIEYQSRGERLPTELTAYNMETLRDSLRPQQPPARKKKNNLLRDIFIAMLVASVCERFGLTPTGRSPHRKSGCAIVATALGEVNMRRGEAAIVAIWRKYKHVVVPL